MPSTRGTPLAGDRSAFDTVSYSELHALDIANLEFVVHVPIPTSEGQFAVSDENNHWVARTIETTDIPDLSSVYLTPSAHTSIGNGSPHHAPVTLTANADALLSVSDQQIDTQDFAPHALWIGPDSGAIPATPTARTLVALDLPSHTHSESEITDLSLTLDDLSDVDAAAPNADDVLTWDGADWVPTAPQPTGAMMLFSQVVDVTVANSTDETTVLGAGRGTKTLTAGVLDQGSVIVIVGHGYLSTSGTPTLNLEVTLGGTLVCSTGVVTLADTISDQGFSFRAEIVCRSTGATGSVVAGGTFEYSDDSEHKLLKTSATAVDTTAALAVDVTVTWGTAHASNTATCQVATIQLIKADELAVAAPSGLTAVEV